MTLNSPIPNPEIACCVSCILHPFPPFPVQAVSMSHLDNPNWPLASVPESQPSPADSHYCHSSDLSLMETSSWSFSSLQSVHWAHIIPRKNSKSLAEYTKSCKLPSSPGLVFHSLPGCEDAPPMPWIFMSSQLLFIPDPLPRNALLSSPD